MARARAAKGKGGGSGDGGSTPARASAGARSRKRRQGGPPSPRPQQRKRRVEKSGTVTKDVQRNKTSRFIQEVIAELRKVSWPDRQTLLQSTAVVLVVVAIVSAYLAVIDTVFERAVDAMF